METLVLIAAAVAVIWKVVDGVKLIAPRLPALGVQAVAWIVGVAVAFILRESDLAGAYSIGSLTLSGANAWTTLILGFALGSSSSATVDAVKAVDNTRTSQPGATVVVMPEDSTVSRS